VTVRLQGRDVPGRRHVVIETPQVESALAVLIQKASQYARYFNIVLDAQGRPRAQDVAEAAKTRVVVQITLSGSDQSGR